MNEPARILLVTSEPVTIAPPTDRIMVSARQPTDWSDVVEQLRGFTHLADGPVDGAIASDVLLETLAASEARTVLLFALPGYEWIEAIVEVPWLLCSVTQAIDGLLVVAPTSVIPQFERPQWLADAYYVSASPLLELLSHAELRPVNTPTPVGRPMKPFRLPLLAPPSPKPEPGSQQSMNAAKNSFAKLGSEITTMMAGWFQMNDLLDASHTLAQSIEGHPDGDYWHAIMHRREPDYGNSKYWFRHVGRHPVFADLAPRAAEILSDAPSGIGSEWAKRLKIDSGWNPLAFVDMCQQAASDEDSDLGRTARRIQWIEMLLLLRHCARST